MKRTNLWGRLATAVVGLAVGVLVGAAYLTACGATAKADLPLVGPGGVDEQPRAPAPVFTGSFAGVDVPMPPSVGGNGAFYGTGTAGMTAVTVYYWPWYNADDLDLNDPADVAKLKDLVRVQVTVGNGAAETWEYDGPALATWNAQYGEVNGATYNCEKQGPNGGVGVFANCAVTLITD